MSDWNRSDREEQDRRFLERGRERREFSERERLEHGEHRSFDGDRESYRRREEQDSRARLGAQAGRTSAPDASYRYPRYADYDRHEYDPQTFASQRFARPEYGLTNDARAYGGAHDYRDTPRSAAFGNSSLARVTDGEADHAMGDNMGRHRGRGPKNYSRSDERIRDDLNDRLTDDSWLDASNIDVEVKSGEITLSGTVDSRDDKRRAEDIADRISGVRHVQNNLRVEQPQAR